MSPLEYKALYDKLQVRLLSGETKAIRLNQYRLRSLNYNTAAASAFLKTFKKRGLDADLNIFVNSELVGLRIDREMDRAEVAFKKTTKLDVFRGEERQGREGPVNIMSTGGASALTDWGALFRYVFAGKGAPEHCQIVLQLTDHWGLAPDGLQAYADSCMGLDCNGFVGNYLWHGKHGHAWTKLGLGNLDLGPDALISGFFDRATPLHSWSQIDPSRCYVLGMVDSAGTIIPGGGGVASAGHLAITEPGRTRPGKAGDPFAIYSVEATGGHTPGLWESWYSYRGVRNKVFDIDREAMNAGSRYLQFKIAAVS